MIKKKYIYLSIIILIIIIGGIIYRFSKSTTEMYYNEIATIVESRTFEKVIAKLNSNGKELDIYSNIFDINDKVNVEYLKKNNKFSIIKIEAVFDTQKELSRLVSNIRRDVNMTKYRSMMNGYIDTSKMEGSTDGKLDLQHFDVLPEKISGQHYITINPDKFFEIKYYLTDTAFLPTPEGLDITIMGTTTFKVLSIENEYDGNIKEIPYDFEDKSFTLKSIGYGVYSARIEFKNGDIINYIFI